MKIYYIANARMPTEKAHGIQIAKMCEAFIEAGADLSLVAPRRVTDARSVREYYGLRVNIPIIYLPTIDWYTGGRIGYFISSLSFMISYSLFILHKKISGEKFVLYTVDTDSYSSSALAFLGLPLFSEMHGAKPRTLAQRILFKNARGIIAINKIIVKELQENFPRSRARYIVEPNGVDLSKFAHINKQDAREKLDLPLDDKIVLYAGRFFEWKGLEILPISASITSQIRWQVVGGSEEDFKRLIKEPLPSNMFFSGSRPHTEMPLWLASADALLVLGTIRDTQSYRYTSPMKLFEYLAVGRPIVASKTPAISEIVTEEHVFFYTPDDVQDLSRVVQNAITDGEETAKKVESSKLLAENSSWRARAERIVQFIEENTQEKIHA